MKKNQILGLVLVVLLCLSGCGSPDVIETDTLSLLKDGTATYTIVSDFSDPAYNLEELKGMAQAEVTEYGTGVIISNAVVEEGMLHFEYTFDSISHYAAFMGTSCYAGTVSQALKEGYKGDTKLLSVKDGSSVMMKDDAVQGYKLFIWNEPVAVRCSGNVVYHSENVSAAGKKGVQPVTNAVGPFYVIYK